MPKRSLQIFNSDQVNRAKMRVPASALMEAEESHLVHVMKHGLMRGMPVNLQHDLTRPAGWSATLGHFIDGAMVRVVGLIQQAETEAERAELAEFIRRYWECHHTDGSERLRKELAERVVPEVLDEQDTVHLRVETAVAIRDGLAARLYPDLFDPSSEHVDKDGLVDYSYLLTRCKVRSPGVFVDEKRQLVLFAHRYFRRGQAHVNKLNDYFLRSFSKAAKDVKLRARLRLDPDRVGHPDEVKELLEFEYWHGPRYSDDIASIPSGVAEHKADEGTRDYEGVDKTHVWWKPPETRSSGEGARSFRTLELEELRDIPSSGLPGERYGCRYAHAEYSLEDRCITHFDGAIRAYPVERYLERIDLNIDRAGKHSEYTKLFRFDGILGVDQWKRLLSDYFKGNPLVPEYLGAQTDGLEDERDVVAEQIAKGDAQADAAAAEDALSAFIWLNPGCPMKQLELGLRPVVLADGIHIVQVMEVGFGAVDKLLRARKNLAAVASIQVPDDRLQLVPLKFGASERFPGTMHAFVRDLSEALAVDVASLGLKSIALCLSWPQGDLIVSLSLRGPSDLVQLLLSKLFVVVDATKPASDWIEALAAQVRTLDPRTRPSKQLDGVLEGTLSFERSGLTAELMFPPELSQVLIEKKLVDVRQPPGEQSE
ncbi:hypothetical protein [Roseateles noduli]|uniref:hypothetical protein n=1 Tax=Roseateles noduli TaxID=2052484 RepID=UPI003D64CE31